MTVIATDSFTRADATSLGTNWTDATPSTNFWKVSSNTAIPNTVAAGGGDAFSWYNAATWPNDQYAKASLTISGGNPASNDTGPGLIARKGAGTGASAYDSLYWATTNHGTNGAIIYKVVSGAFTQIGSAATVTWTDGDAWELDANGSAIAFKHTGTSVASGTDSAVTSGSPGLLYSASTAGLTVVADNWEGGDFSAGFDPSAVPWPVQLPDSVQIQLVEF